MRHKLGNLKKHALELSEDGGDKGSALIVLALTEIADSVDTQTASLVEAVRWLGCQFPDSDIPSLVKRGIRVEMTRAGDE